MIKQQLDAWRDFYQGETESLTNKIHSAKKEMEKITSDVDVDIRDFNSFLIALSIEFKQYQSSMKIGSHLHQLMAYPTIYRYGLLKSDIRDKEEHLNQLREKTEKINKKIIKHQSRPFCQPHSPYGSPTLGWDIDHAKRQYTRSFKKLGETERYSWYTSELRKKLSVSFRVHVQCKSCHEYFDIHIWKHYPLITPHTDLKTAAIYEIGADTDSNHGFSSDFFYRLLDRKQILYKFWEILIQKYRIISVENIL